MSMDELQIGMGTPAHPDRIGREADSDSERGRIDKITMPFLHLGVYKEDPDAPSRADIERVLNNAKDWLRYAPNCWIIYTARDAKWWSDKLLKIPGMEDNAGFLIAEMLLTAKEKRAGWLTESTWQWINKDRSGPTGKGCGVAKSELLAVALAARKAIEGEG